MFLVDICYNCYNLLILLHANTEKAHFGGPIWAGNVLGRLGSNSPTGKKAGLMRGPLGGCTILRQAAKGGASYLC